MFEALARMITSCKHIYCYLIANFLFIGIISAQQECKVETYSTEQGLSHQAVTCVLKDQEGFMWFGSWDGINRFDGHSFISYKSSPGDKSILGNDRVDQILEDQSGHLWILAYDKQVYRFDKKTKEFFPLAGLLSSVNKSKMIFWRIISASNGLVWLQTENQGIFCIPQDDLSASHIMEFQKERPDERHLPSNNIRFWHKDQNNFVWIGTTEGLACLLPTPGSAYKNTGLVPPSFATGIDYTAIEEDDKNLYFSTSEGNLLVFDKLNKVFFTQKISDSKINNILKGKQSNILYASNSAGELVSFDILTGKKIGTEKLNNEAIFNMYEDKKGCLWIEPEKLGVICYNPSKRTSQLFFEKNAKYFKSVGNRFKVLEDINGTLWVNMKGGGFGYYDAEKNEIVHVLNTPDGTGYHLPNIVYAIYFDKAGILWITTDERQLIKVILLGNDFNKQLLVKDARSKADNEVRGILYDKQERLWIGTKSGKLYVFKNEKNLRGLFDNEPAEGLGLVYTILQDHNGNMWLGTKGNGLYEAIPIEKKQSRYHLIHFPSGKESGNGLDCNEIYSLLEDKSGRIWIGSFDAGLFLAQEDNGVKKFIHTGNAFAKYPKENFRKIRYMSQDGDGNIWIATTGGLLIMNANEKINEVINYVSYSKIPGDPTSLGNNDIQFIQRDSKNRMWLSTSGGGFCLAIGRNVFQSLKFRNYTTKDGLPNNYVLSSVEDKNGNLWLGTENGLSEFKPDSNLFKNYDSYEGLPIANFSEAATCRSNSNNHLFFGTTKGYLSFDPALLSNMQAQANIAFTNLQVNNQEAGPSINDSIVKSDVNFLQELDLRYNQNIISIDYAILDFRAGNRQVFAYRLRGFDDEWHIDKTQRRATYTNLPPGHYVFEIKSINSDLYSNIPYKQLAITIFPPPWKTWWAYVLYSLFILGLLILIRRTALSMIRLRNKIALERKLAALKLQFFTNVSHELRTPLTLILNPIEQLSRKENLSPQGAAYIELARRNANRMIRFINQLLDLRKVESNKATLSIARVEIVEFVKRISDYFREAAKSRQIELEILPSKPELLAWVDAEKLDVIIYNILGNALKFTPDRKSISVFIKEHPAEECFSIAVSDQGPGVPKEQLKDIFELFYEGDHPQERTLKGTGIGLALCREFVELHEGKIWATNNEQTGLTVTFKLKIKPSSFGDKGTAAVQPPEKQFNKDNIEKPIIASTTKPNNRVQGSQAPLVLLVEDNDELRNFLSEQLGEYYRVEVAKDGQEGLRKAVDLVPDLVLSDIMMPIMDGIQLLDKVKNSVSTSHIPVVLLSAKHSIESQVEGLKYGADYYITKPFSNEFLVASINNLLNQRKKLFESLFQKRQAVELSPSPIIVTSLDESFLKEVIHNVEEKMADPAFNIDIIAESLLMSRTTFYKKFKSLTGLTPVEFVRDIRLQRAKQYLDAGNNNVSEAAYLTGFSNPKYFSTCFKEKYHISPSDYLRSKVD